MTPSPTPERLTPARCLEIADFIDSLVDTQACESGRSFALRAHAAYLETQPDLLEALKLFMDMWNSGDSHRSSKRAQQRRADMWDKANAAVAKAEGREPKPPEAR